MPIDPSYRIGTSQNYRIDQRASSASAAFGAFTTQVRIVASAAVQYRHRMLRRLRCNRYLAAGQMG